MKLARWLMGAFVLGVLLQGVWKPGDVQVLSETLGLERIVAIGIFLGVIYIFKKYVFQRDIVLGFFIKIIQRFNQCGDVIGFIDGHYLVAFFIISTLTVRQKIPFTLWSAGRIKTPWTFICKHHMYRRFSEILNR